MMTGHRCGGGGKRGSGAEQVHDDRTWGMGVGGRGWVRGGGGGGLYGDIMTGHFVVSLLYNYMMTQLFSCSVL